MRILKLLHIYSAKKFFCSGRSSDRYDVDPGDEATFCGFHKITVLIWFVRSTKGLSKLELQKVIRKKIQKNKFFKIY